MVWGIIPRGWTNGAGSEGCDGAGVNDLECFEESTGARPLRGCWRMLTRSSTRRLEARGAMPGRVTVHCWSRVASLRDLFILA
jgi:hypothetical protein